MLKRQQLEDSENDETELRNSKCQGLDSREDEEEEGLDEL